MRSLAYDLLNKQPDDCVWISPDHVIITAGDVVSFLAAVPIELWIGKRVALGDLSPLALLLATITLDGVADTLMFLPSGEPDEVSSSRILEHGIDYVVHGDEFPQLGSFQQRRFSPDDYKYAVADLLTSRQVLTSWCLPTSGTSGKPKIVRHSILSLLKYVSNTVYGEKFIWASLYSFRRFAGLQVFLQSWVSCCPLILLPEAGSLDSIVCSLVEFRCNALSATPTMWRKLSMSKSFSCIPLAQITLGGEIVDQPILNLLSHSFPAARITHIYASTELGVGFVVRDNRSGFPSDYLREFSPSGRFSIGDAGMLLSLVPVESDDQCSLVEQWLETGDIVTIVEDRVYFVGRFNGSINVGGNKVMPEEIEAVILELNEVNTVHVRARKSSIVGSLIEAVVVVKSGFELDAVLRSKILNHCRTMLDGYKVPTFIVKSDGLDTTEAGKLSRVVIQ
jgi:acyl-CoA synthetase (AMP-forming)/AMP-acid ligase II